MNVDACTVLEVKAKIKERKGIPIHVQRLVTLTGHQLMDGDSMSDIPSGATLDLHLRLCGGHCYTVCLLWM